MAENEKGLSAALDTATDSEETESSSEEEEESFEEYESGGEEAAGEADTVKADTAQVINRHFNRAMHYVHSAVLRSYVVRPPVCLSVTFRYRDHIGWNSSKIIARSNSLGPM